MSGGDYLLVGYIGKTPNGSVYHSLSGSRRSKVDNLSGANFRPLCGRVSPVKVSHFDATRVDLSNHKYCKNCQGIIRKWKRKAKTLRYLGAMPESNYTEFFGDVKTYSLGHLRIRFRMEVADRR